MKSIVHHDLVITIVDPSHTSKSLSLIVERRSRGSSSSRDGRISRFSRSDALSATSFVSERAENGMDHQFQPVSTKHKHLLTFWESFRVVLATKTPTESKIRQKMTFGGANLDAHASAVTIVCEKD